MSSESVARLATVKEIAYFLLRSLRWSGVAEDEIWRVGALCGLW